ncbi:MAG TPA: SRPBCC domain-containing protein [Capillimicrobium sp.]
MIVEGSETLDADPQALVAVLGDPERLVEALPRADGFAWIDRPGGAFEATIRPAIALGEVPVRTRWQRGAGTGPGTVVYAVEGRTDEHAVALDVELAVRTGADGGAVADWRAACRFTGTVNSVGQRVLAPVVAAQARLVLRAAASHGGI